MNKNTGLTFNQLREANKKRLPQFKNSKGEPAHEKADGSDWSLGEWMNAVTGELGEAANIIKKVKRGDITLSDARVSLAKEFADIVTYLDITAMQAGIDLGESTIDKFNEVSDRVGSNIKLQSTQTKNDITDKLAGFVDERLKQLNKIFDLTPMGRNEKDMAWIKLKAYQEMRDFIISELK